MGRIIGMEIGASQIVAAVAGDEGAARVVLGADASWPSAVALTTNGAAVDRWKWSIDALASSAHAAAVAMRAVAEALGDRGAGAASMTVLALSSGYGDRRAACLVDAAASAGFPAIRVLDECAATTLGVGRTWLRGRGLVIDLGARHLSASVVALSGERINNDASEATEDVHLDAVLEGLLREVVDRVERDDGAGALDGSARDDVRRELSAALRRRTLDGPLRFASSAVQRLRNAATPPMLGVDEDVIAWLREEVLLKAHELAVRALDRAGVPARDVARVWLTGGAAGDSSLRAALGRHLHAEVLVAHPDLTACGAARFGAELLGSVSHTPLPRRPEAEVSPALPNFADVVEVDHGRHLTSSLPPAEEPPPPAPTPPPPSTASSPAEVVIERPSGRTERASVPPPPTNFSRTTFTPGGTQHLPSQGPFRGPRTPVELLAMPLMRAPTPEELTEPFLPVLLLQLATAHATGILALSRDGEDVRVLISDGGVCVSVMDRARLLRVLEWTRGTFRWSSAALQPAAAKLREPMLGFVASGLRGGLRGMRDEAVLSAFGPRLALSPTVIPAQQKRVEKLDLGAAESRAIEHVLDGSRDVPTLLAEGYIGRLTLMRVLLLLDAFGVLRWSPPLTSHVETPVERLERHLRRMSQEDHFTALGLHWTATHDEVIEAWARFQREYGPEGRAATVDRGLAAKVLARGAEAWERLRDDRRRVAYRHELHPDVDETLLATIVAAQAELLAFRGEEREVRSMRALAVEMANAAPPGVTLKDR